MEDILCKNPDCNKLFSAKKRDHRRYCSISCSTSTNNRLRPRTTHPCLVCGILTRENRYQFCSNKCQRRYQFQNYIIEWKSGNRVGLAGKKIRFLSNYIQHYLIGKYGNKCTLCGWDEVHPVTNRIPLQVDHIDGNAENNTEENLRLICPNCHSLTLNYGNLNRGNGRSWRYPKNAL